MIPAEHFHDNGDGTAWLVFDVVRPLIEVLPYYRHLDRPCDICGGSKILGSGWGEHMKGQPCPPCRGTGRHTFEIQVQTGESWPPVIVFPRVSIVPGMVLPIVEADLAVPVPSIVTTEGHCWLVDEPDDPTVFCEREVTLPPAAAPGMWAVKLAIT